MSYRRKVRHDYSGYVTCQNEDCEEEMEATFEPGTKGSWDEPAYGPDVDGPDECPKCGRRTTRADRQAWTESLGEEAEDGDY